MLVVLMYYTLSDANKNLYNGAVMRHNASLLMLVGILILLGYCQLSDCQFNKVTTRLLWLSLQYFTIVTIFWLNVICFDMTLVITRFCWIPAAGDREDENQKIVIYSILAWGGAMVPSVLAAFFEFIPQIPSDFLWKANFMEASNGPRLFVVTTYSIVKVQRSTEVAMKNQKILLRKKYILFLRLYLFMGAPWFFGTVLAGLNKLAVLKVCRML